MAQRSRLLTSFYLTTRVASDLSNDISEMDDKTPGAVHIIELKNMTPVPRDAQTVGFLPNTTYVAFNADAGTTDKWSCEDPFRNMVQGKLRAGQCRLSHIKAAPNSQPIQVTEVNTKRVNAKNFGSDDRGGKLPFEIDIDVK